MEEKKPDLSEGIFLLVVFGILLWMGLGAYYDHELDYDYPKGFMATDSFYKYDRTLYLDETADNKHIDPSLTGGVEGLEELYPYFSFQNIVIFKDATGLRLYNSQFLLNVLYVILAGLLAYTLIKRYNKKVALLSLGIYGFLFIGTFYTGFLFGWWPQISGSFLLVSIIWAMLNFDLKGFYILLGIMVSAAFLAHPPEAMFGGLFCLILFCIDFVKNRFDLKMLKKGIISFIIFVPLTIYYWPIFLKSFLLGGSAGGITFVPKASTFPAPEFSHFGFYGIFIAIGIIAAVVLLFNSKGKDWKYFAMAFFMGLITYSAWIGINERVYQNSFFWPIYFGILFGLGIYIILKFLPVKIPNLVYYIIPLILLFVSLTNFFQPPSSSGLVANKDMWDGMMWVRYNVPWENKVLVFYGDSYNQHGIYSMFGHVMYNTDWNYLPNNIGYDLSESIAKIQKGEITRNYTIRPFIHHKDLPKRTSFLTIEYIDVFKLLGLNYEKIDGKGRGFEQRDLCSFNYIIFDKISRYPELQEYNLKVRNALLEKEYIKEVFSNGWYSILKNEKTGEACV
jgi:hypothetical protein